MSIDTNTVVVQQQCSSFNKNYREKKTVIWRACYFGEDGHGDTSVQEGNEKQFAGYQKGKQLISLQQKQP